jgi:transposase
MNSTDIFALALNLQKPWKIDDISFNEINGKRHLNINIAFIRGSQFLDEMNEPCKVHDTKARTWRHLNFFEHECYIHCNVPRIKTSKGKTEQIQVPWGRENSGFTMLFEAFAMSLIESEMPITKAGKLLGEYPNRLWTIFNFWVGISYNSEDHSKVTTLGIDETSSKKGHSYVTVGVDMKHRKVIHACEGKDSNTIKTIKEYLESKGSPASQIEQVCIDLSPAFISGVTTQFQNAKITFDRFHVKQHLNKAMDELRKTERVDHAILKNHKYTFLKSNKKLSDEKKDERDKLIELFPSLGEGYRLKELFDEFWEMKDIEDSEGFLQYWCDLAEESNIPSFQKFVNLVKRHWKGILNYLESKLNNGILEGINSKIQLAKRRARGYRNMTNYINMIYLIAGKLKFNYPHRST